MFGRTSRPYEAMRWLPLRSGFPRLILTGIMVCLTTLFLWGDGSLLQAQELEDLKKGVVKIIATVEGRNRVGTGIIVGLETNLCYIATAAHVVAGDSSPNVVFYSQSTHRWESRVLGMDAGNPKGLAVLAVEEKKLPEMVVLELDSNFSIPERASLDIIGFPRVVGVPWAPLPGTMIGRKGPDFVFSGAADEGNSGGPVLYQGKVVGIVMEAGNGFGNAVPSPTVRFTLDGWGIHVEQGSSQVEEIVIPDNRKVDRTPEISVPVTVISAEEIQIPLKETTGNDGAPMVLVPAGEFTMGSNDGDEDEKPLHTVDLDAFYIDQYEVTVEGYQRFLTQTRRATPDYWEHVSLRRDAQKPVVGIDWDDAQAYCQWAEKRLPTEAEWEKAARGTDQRTYPWGESKPNSRTANFGKGKNWDVVYAEALKAVGSYERGRSPYKAYDMAGNVWEWVADWYDQNYYGNSPTKNPQGPLSGAEKVLRGGSWYNDPSYLRSATRYWIYPSERLATLGVRCAQDAP